MTIQEKIKLYRKQKRIPQSVIAKALNITTQGYSKKERGERAITTDEIKIIADCIGVPVTYFFENEINVKLNKTTTA